MGFSPSSTKTTRLALGYYVIELGEGGKHALLHLRQQIVLVLEKQLPHTQAIWCSVSQTVGHESCAKWVVGISAPSPLAGTLW